MTRMMRMSTRIRKAGSPVRLLLLFLVSLFLFNTLSNPAFRTVLGDASSPIDYNLVPDKVHQSILATTTRTESAAAAAALNHRSETAHPTTTAPIKRRAKLADECYHVFLDCGSNLGVHGRFLFEPHKYPNSTFVTIFDQQFGSHRTQQNICVFAFEPNPRHTRKQLMTQAKYKIMGWRYHYIPVGVSDSDGNLTFYRNLLTSNGTFNEEHGFSLFIKDAKKLKVPKPEDEAVVVPLIDLASWVFNEVQDRVLPAKTNHNLGPPRVVMKMDIEGSEYRTLLRLYKTGAHRVFHAIVGERHTWALPQEVDGKTFRTVSSLRRYFRKLTSVLGEDGGPGFLHFDDEEYPHDGLPYPDPDNRSTW